MKRVSTAEGYRLWAPVYDASPNPLVSLERRTTWRELQPLRPRNLIEVACGTGHWMLRFQQLGAQVYGCDTSQEMLSEAWKAPSLRGRLALADAESIPFGGSTADLVLCSMSLGYFRDIHRVFREFAHTVEPGGRVAVSDLHPDAALSGWTRSFKLGDRRYELEHYLHTTDEVQGAAAAAGLTPKVFRAAHFEAPERPAFERAGKDGEFNALSAIPALFFGLWEKAC